MAEPVLKLGILASGRGSNMQAIMDNCELGAIPARVVAVVSDKGDARALETARSRGVFAAHVNPKSFADKEAYEAAIVKMLKGQGVECVCLAGYMRIVGRTLLDGFPMRVLNIHPALLPSFPGLHGQKQALDYGVKVSGCTVHFVDSGMDTGPIIIQTPVPVLDDDTEETLSARILKEEHRIYSEAIGLLARGRLRIEGRGVLRTGED